LGAQCIDAEAKKRGRKKNKEPGTPDFRMPGTVPTKLHNADAEYLQVLASSMLQQHSSSGMQTTPIQTPADHTLVGAVPGVSLSLSAFFPTSSVRVE
jgi:hypothetical protein